MSCGAGQKISAVEKAIRDLSLEEKQNLIQEIKEKGFVDLAKEAENERD